MHKDGINQLGDATNVSWNETNQICTSHNATMLSFSGYNDVLDVQALLVEVLDNNLPLPVFLGLKSDLKVSNLFISLIFKSLNYVSNKMTTVTPIMSVYYYAC